MSGKPDWKEPLDGSDTANPDVSGATEPADTSQPTGRVSDVSVPAGVRRVGSVAKDRLLSEQPDESIEEIMDKHGCDTEAEAHFIRFGKGCLGAAGDVTGTVIEDLIAGVLKGRLGK